MTSESSQSSSNDFSSENNQDVILEKSIINIVFEKINQFEDEYQFKHLVFATTAEGTFMYIPFISMEFYHDCATFFKLIFSQINFLNIDGDTSKTDHDRFTPSNNLERFTTCVKSKAKTPERKFIKDLQSFIQKNTKPSTYWFIFQFNFHSINDSLRTKNHPITNEDSKKICEFFTQKYQWHVENGVYFSDYMQNNLYDYFQITEIRKQRSGISSYITQHVNIIDSTLHDDDDE